MGLNDRYITLKEFIRRAIDEGRAHEVHGLMKLFSAEWVENIYKSSKSPEPNVIPGKQPIRDGKIAATGEKKDEDNGAEF